MDLRVRRTMQNHGFFALASQKNGSISVHVASQMDE